MTGNISTLTLTVAAAGALAASRFVTQAGAYPAAGAAAFGVTRTSAAAAGDLVPVDVQGTAIVEVGTGGVTQDGALMADANGCVVALTGLSKSPVGRAMETAAAGAFIEVLLVPSAGLLTPAA